MTPLALLKLGIYHDHYYDRHYKQPACLLLSDGAHLGVTVTNRLLKGGARAICSLVIGTRHNALELHLREDLLLLTGAWALAARRRKRPTG